MPGDSDHPSADIGNSSVNISHAYEEQDPRNSDPQAGQHHGNAGAATVPVNPNHREEDRRTSFSTSTTITAHRQPSEDEHRGQRAPQACLRCRRKKLRCTGGCPCTKCIRAKESCDFGKKPTEGSEPIPGLDSAIRIAQLEKTVADLLSGLASRTGTATITTATAGSGSGNAPPTAPTLAQIGVDQSSSVYGNRHADHTGGNPDLISITPQAIFNDPGFLNHIGGSSTSDPIVTFNPSSNSSTNGFSFPPGNIASADNAIAGPSRTVHFGPSPTESQTGGPRISASSTTRPDKASPQNRLAVASQIGQGYSAPFQALTYQPALWENREPSRRNSPQPGEPSRDETWPAFEAKAGPKDDPLTLELVNIAQAEILLDFFFTRCHPFLPIVTTAEPDLSSRFQEICRRCSYLFTTIIAIGARFYLKHCIRKAMVPAISPGTPAAIARLAYSHLAASLFRKQHQLADVQATLLLAGWGLQSGGGGPDPWLVTGHCARLAQRLGMHRLTASIGSGTTQSEKYLTQSRTWLCWYHFDGFLSLGFGRPQSTGFEGVNEQTFLQLCATSPSRPEMRLDLYIASMVQLTKIGRDLISWIQLLTDWQTEPTPIPLTKDGQDLSIGSMLRELNTRLDGWTTLWTWNGSLSAIQLGACGRLAKLQSEHIRLCLNSLALRPALMETEAISMTSYIQKAYEAAINTVQSHADAVKEDMYLSYSVDYITIALGQAAVFLIRLHSTPSSMPIDRAVIAHYLRTAIELLEDTDMSETKNSTYVGRVCRDLSGVAGISIPPRVTEESPSQLQFWNNAGLPLIDFNTDLDLESFLQFDNSGMDLGMLFGLPTDALNMRDLGPMLTGSEDVNGDM